MRYFLFAFLILAACKNNSGSNGTLSSTADQIMKPTDVSDLPAGFLDFYKKFHEDSLYQMAHITWPLQGEGAVQVDSVHMARKARIWEASNWRMHRPVDFRSGDFKQEFQTLGDVLVIEKIRYRAANFGLERRFALNEKNEWELIFYADMIEGN